MDVLRNKIKILLIDNDEMMRIYFRDIFWIHDHSGKYDVDIASSLEEAKDKILNKDTRPDTLFLDVFISSKNEKNSPDEQIKRTLSFIEMIKTNTEISSIKIIIYSSQKEKFIKDKALKAGANGYIVKGEIMPKELIDFTDKIHEPNN